MVDGEEVFLFVMVDDTLDLSFTFRMGVKLEQFFDFPTWDVMIHEYELCICRVESRDVVKRTYVRGVDARLFEKVQEFGTEGEVGSWDGEDGDVCFDVLGEEGGEVCGGNC